MSQRRGGPKDKAVVAVSKEELVPFSEVLDPPSTGLEMDRESIEPLQIESAPNSGNGGSATAIVSGNDAVSLDARFNAENQQLKIKAWREGPFATGFTPA
jgi:hypothetical protein